MPSEPAVPRRYETAFTLSESVGTHRTPVAASGSGAASGQPDPASERGYVLGTHDAEVERLAFQHAIWSEEAHRAWRAAGIAPGARVADIGAGPGFAALDLARLVGPEGKVHAVERSRRFLDLLDGEARRVGFPWIESVEADLMHGPLPIADLDLVWCRWVACFVPDARHLVRSAVSALRPGGRIVMHEYHAYSTYGILPDRAEIRSFVNAVYESWRAQGGEPDIGRVLPKMLVESGCEIASTRPIGFAARAGERLWRWPAGFVRTNVPRLVELGIRDTRWADEVLAALEESERDPAAVFVTPTVLEIIAVRR